MYQRYRKNHYLLKINEKEAYETQIDPITYAPCTCREKYFLYPENLLALYLEEKCKGWVRDPESRYTLNYLVLVLIANFKDKGLLQYDTEYDFYFVITDKRLKSVFEYGYFKLKDLRAMIATGYLNIDEKKSIIKNAMPPILYCLGETRGIAQALLNKDWFINSLVGTWDHWDLKSYPKIPHHHESK